MSGHSKWANIKHRKGRQDAVKGKIYTKMARLITVSAREGGADPNYNANLKAAIEKAKAANMPNDNIDRAVKKGAGNLDGSNFEEIQYEGYGPGGVAVIVKVLTDNRNRAAADVRYFFSKAGGNLGANGSVSFMFDKKGVLIIDNEDEKIEEDEFMLLAIEAGAEDISFEDGIIEVITEPTEFMAVMDALKNEGFNFEKAEVTYIPQNYQSLEDDKIKPMQRMLDMMDESDDIQDVYHNWEEDEE